tara:strand:- start:1782 stop:2630 length:849 start_codon:yes stop_codon:yes gene_type:complete
MRDIILALGCSFTDPNFYCDDPSAKHLPENLKGGWPMWPEIFTERLSKKDNVEYKLINRGQSASSMEYSSIEFFSNWTKNKDRLKAVLWGGTQLDRVDHLYHEYPFHLGWLADIPEERKRTMDMTAMKDFGMYEYMHWLASETANSKIYVRQSKIWLNRLIGIRDLCEAHGVHFIYYPLLSFFTTDTYKNVGGRDTRIDQKLTMLYILGGAGEAYEEITTSKNWIGVSSLLEGWNSWRRKYNMKGYTIGENKEYPNLDAHPNEEGQICIADEFWSHYEKNFT